jgi:hypothetical protein
MMLGRMRGAAVLGSVVGLFLWGRVASAAAPPVSLALDGCPHLSPTEVERILSAELGATLAVEGGPNVTEVTIVCEDVRVLVRVKDPLSRKTVQRSFDTSTFDMRATPRLIALAASELVLASWAELYSNPTPSVEPEGPIPSPESARAAREALRELTLLDPPDEPEPRSPTEADEPDERVMRVLALASLRAFTANSSMLYGGGARVGEERFRLVAWTLDTLIENGPVVATVGDRTIRSNVTSWTFGASLLAYYRFEVLTLRAGAGLRAGIVAADEATIAPWGWPLGVASFTLRIGSFVTDVSGEAGYVAFSVNEGEVRGYWMSAQLGLGMVL